MAFDLEAAVALLAHRYFSAAGVDADLFAAWAVQALPALGADPAATEAAVTRVTGWRPRTAEEREIAVAKSMLDDGWSPKEVAAALRQTEERVAC